MKFSSVIGQKEAKEKALGMLRENRLPHALILTGPSGTGKLPMANAIAQYLNCENPGADDSCGECSSCKRISKGIHPDVHFVLPIISKGESDKPALSSDSFPEFRELFFSNPYFSFGEWSEVLKGENKQLGIHIFEIRELKHKVPLKAFEGKYKVIIIWNAELINKSAGNAMLKMLEEPPDQTVFILTASDPEQLLPTILSRCQRLQLHRVETNLIENHLINEHNIDKSQAHQVALLAEGSVSAAIQLVGGNTKTFSELYQNWMRICHKGDHEKINKWAESLARENKDHQKLFLGFALQKLRDSMLFSFQAENLSVATEDEIQFHKGFSKFLQQNGALELAKIIEESLYYIGGNANSHMVYTVLSLRIHGLLNGKVLI